MKGLERGWEWEWKWIGGVEGLDVEFNAQHVVFNPKDVEFNEQDVELIAQDVEPAAKCSSPKLPNCSIAPMPSYPTV